MISSHTTLSLVAQSQNAPDLLRAYGLPVILMAIVYFIVLAPMQRRQKKTQEMLGALKNGDKVVTNGGLFGTIVGIEGDSVQLRIADQVKVKVLRSHVAALQPESKEE